MINNEIPIFIIKVQLKNKITRLLKIYKNDDPKEVALNFGK